MQNSQTRELILTLSQESTNKRGQTMSSQTKMRKSNAGDASRNVTKEEDVQVYKRNTLLLQEIAVSQLEELKERFATLKMSSLDDVKAFQKKLEFKKIFLENCVQTLEYIERLNRVRPMHQCFVSFICSRERDKANFEVMTIMASEAVSDLTKYDESLLEYFNE
jgi:hypothetical protein